MKATIRGCGLYVPEKVVPNTYFDDLYQKNISQFLEEVRNIKQRHFMDENQSTSDLIVPAIEEALKQADVTAAEVDLLIVATDTPDYISPSTASVVQHKMGLKNAGTFDLNSACSGFVTALETGNGFLMARPQYKNIVVVGAYGMSKHLDFADYKIASMFADGAGAAVLQRSDDESLGIHACEMYTDGQYHDYMGIYSGGTARPTTHEQLEKNEHKLKFLKKIPVETNGIHWPRLTNKLLDRTKKSARDIDHFFITQLNLDSINEALEKLGVAKERSHNVMDQFGYTGSACIPMALADASRKSKLKKGDEVILLGSGGGMSMAAIQLTWAFDT